MRILLLQDTVWVPSWGGANKFNRLLLEELAHRGHTCHAITPSHGSQASRSTQVFHSELASRNIDFQVGPHADVFTWNRVSVAAVKVRARTEAFIEAAMKDLAPDWILVASEDPGQRLLSMALKHTSQIVYLARTTLSLPFGPSCAIPSDKGTDCLRQVSGIVVVSEFLREYFKQWAGLDSAVVPISPEGNRVFPNLGNIDNEFVTLVNPCLYKGLSLFCELSEAMPTVQFAAVPTWGTTSADIHRLKQQRNVTLLNPVDDILEILKRTRVLLFPSLWAEAKGMIIVEAMLHGIPVIASDTGGTREAKLGVDYLIPVQPITGFTDEFDERLLPIPIIPDQSLAPWINALHALVTNESDYLALSTRSREAASRANAAEDVGLFENYLLSADRQRCAPTSLNA